MKTAKRSARALGSGDQLVDALARTAFVTMAVLSKIGAENDLSLTQLRVFGILRDRRLRMAMLAEHLGLEKSTISGLIDRAERRGLVARAASIEDGRAIEVFLTDAGRAFAARVQGEVESALQPFTHRLSVAEQRTLRDLLERLLDAPNR